MRISIDNFKTLRSLEEFEFKPFTLITGVNSSGKSSFIQFLLLIKQTLAKPATNSPLNLEGDLMDFGKFEDIIYQKNIENKLSMILSFDDDHFEFPDIRPLKIKSCDVAISFGYADEKLIIQNVEFKYFIPDTLKQDQYLRFEFKDGKYEMTETTGLFNNDFHSLLDSEGKDHLDGEILFSSFFPQLFTTEIKNPDYEKDADEKNDSSRGIKNELDRILENTKQEPFKPYSIAPATKNLEQFIGAWFNNISYIGPLREEPSDFYNANKTDQTIGKKGEYAAFILEKESKRPVTYLKRQISEDGSISFGEVEGTLLEAVNHWICEVFELARQIYSKEEQDKYQVFITNSYGITTTIKHVGFGVSQVLPIVVEGLRMSANAMLILEQPEIHLHPKIQGLLFDFFYSLILMNKNVFIETHSDHLIVKMRRRIAEDQDDKLLSLIMLEFVEAGETGHYFEAVVLTELGSIKEFPRNFIEQQEDYRAIVKAQARKKQK